MKKRYLALIFTFIFLVGEVIFSLTIKHQGAANGRVVVIDPGHGTTTNSRINEGTIELQIGLKLRDILVAKGYQVVMTRESDGATLGGAIDEYTDNVARATIANNAGASAIVRLHSDSYADDKFTIYYPQIQTTDTRDKVGPEDPTTITKSKNLSYQILNSMQENGFAPYPNPVRADTDGGIKPGNYAVSTNLSISTAVSLIEMFGHGSGENMAKYSQGENQDKVAAALGIAIENYLNSPESLVAPQRKKTVSLPKPVAVKPAVVKKVEPKKPAFSLESKNKISTKEELLVLEKEEVPKITHSHKLTFSGKTAPEAAITITIKSDPITININADKEGSWSYLLDPDELDLELGIHTVTAYATDSNKINSDEIELSKFELYAIAINGKMPEVDNNSTFKKEITSATNTILLMLALFLTGLLVFLFVQRRSRLHSI